MSEPRGNLVVGVDIGGTKTAVLVADADDRVHGRALAPTPLGAPHAAAPAIAALVRDALDNAHATTADVAALGVGVPGRVDREGGHVTLAVNLGWHDLPLGPGLEHALGIPTVVENDVRAASLGLHRRRLFGPVESLALLAVGTGISAGVVLGGELYRGTIGLAGEVGHVAIEPDGVRCACGKHGCLETVAAGPAIVRRARAGWAALGNGHRAAMEAAAEGGAEVVFAAAAAGDPVARDVIESAGRAVAWAVQLLALAYDVERIVIGGGVAHAGESFMAPVRRELDRGRVASPLAAEILPPGLVQLLAAEAEAGAWGAVTIARASLAAREGDDLRISRIATERRTS